MSEFDPVLNGDAVPQLADRFALVVAADRDAREPLVRACGQAGFQALEIGSLSEATPLVSELGVTLCCIACPVAEALGLKVDDLRAALPEHAPILLVTPASGVLDLEVLFDQGVTEVFHPDHIDDLVRYLRRREAERTEPRGQHIYGKRVLLVEDSRTVSRVVKRMLEAHGLLVDSVPSAEDALTHLEQYRYDLLITDLVLEGAMSGMALVGRLREAGYTDFSLPILAMTGFDDTARRQELFRLGVNDYVIKPVLEGELLVRVRNLVIANRLAQRVEAQRARLNLLEVSDVLTGLYNRRMLIATGAKFVAMLKRTGSSFSLVLVDLARLNEVIEQYGYDCGDEVLRQAASLIRNNLRQSDIVARVSGSRFAAILPNCAEEDARGISERLLKALSSLQPLGMQIDSHAAAIQFEPSLDRDFEAMLLRAVRIQDRLRSPGLLSLQPSGLSPS